MLGVYPQYWYSTASISKAYLELFHQNEKWNYWILVQKDKLAHFYIYQSYFGGIFLSKKLGYSQGVSEIDINSAYPYGITNLYSIEGSTMKKVTKPNPGADYGFYHVKLSYNGLIPYRTKKNIIYPVSNKKLDMIMTAIEYNYWRDKIEIEFVDGYEIYTKKVIAFPDYKELYEERQRIKKDKSMSAQMKQWNLKTILNATYGVFAQSKGGYTYWTNFIYASYITAQARLIIYKAIEKIGFENVISILTDAIMFHNYEWVEPDSNKLGDFKLEFKDNDVITYMSGMYVYEDEIQNQFTLDFPVRVKELKKRGFPSLKPDDLIGDSNILLVNRMKVKKLLEGIIQRKVNTIGDFISEDKQLNLLSNLMKYDYDKDKLTFDYLNDHVLISSPILVNQNQNFKSIDWEDYNYLTKSLYRYMKYLKKGKKNEHNKKDI